MFDVQQTTAGEWAVVAAGGRALLVADRDRARLLRYRAALRAGFAETLDALVAGGLSRTPAFALLDTSSATVLLAVRGRASATIVTGGASREVHAGTASSWLETQVDGADRVVLGAAGEGLPLTDGIVWGDGVGWAAAEAASDAEAAEPEGASRGQRDTGPVELGEAQAVAGETVALVPEATITGMTVTGFAEETAADAPVAEADTTGYDHLFGATMMRSVEEAAVRPEDEGEPPARIDLPTFITDSFPAGAAAGSGTGGDPAAAGDHDGMTVFSGDLPPRASRPSTEAVAPPLPARPTFSVLLSDGRREPLSAPVVVGRAPSVSAVPSLPGARPVTLTSAEDDISRSHVAVSVEGDSVVVTDLHSRNGTLIVLPGKSPQKLRSGEPTTVVVGTLIDLGSGATLTVDGDAAEAGA
ncbi:FHA domain-containing protein [Leifsonia sp. F6_8S_P_1B]|uniref:FHA domain-containing protein n=1 Tax=Leifsonia williamsii TaxID=3035919 RepID=A0ABT8KDC4_9MICO|nr:FHA domain-containing protein [Leifsonia williamsii]MDN4614968.1 FHA domain-containing protein [Leifsonia williamsii]